MSDYIDNYYARTVRESRVRPPLASAIDTDVCVIGGGLAGLATALDLAERGRRVALLERHRIGWGASGRNGGFVSPGIPGGMPGLVDRVGLTTAREIYALSRLGHTLLRERIEHYEIDCGAETGALRCAMAGARGSLEGFCDYMAKNFATEMEYWPAPRVRDALATVRYSDAFFNPYTFAVHPLNLARGLARTIEAKGGLVFEQSSVETLDLRSEQMYVRTAAGSVRADHVVIACGGYVDGLHPALAGATVPIATFVMVTEPLGERLKRAIRVPYAISDVQFVTNYYRPLADGRLLWGGRVLAWEPRAPRIATLLKRDMASFYPGLADARVDVAWGGLMPYLKHRLPVFGQIAEGVWYATGFGGLGLALTTTAGRLIAAGIVEGDDRWRIFASFGLPFAGGKFGRIPAQLVYWRNALASKLGHGRSP
jgi:gamma-glutamylputrescine oxidase